MNFRGRWNRIRSLPSVWDFVRVSFGQYAEDLILSSMWPQSRGFYIDVGAYQPRRGSNTYKLYLKGWRGITIEPNPDVARSFEKTRPRDTHLAIGVSNSTSELVYHKVSEAHLNSFDPHWHEKSGIEVVERVPIRCLTLTDVLDQHCPNQPIDLLSIDCEGHDMQVAESLEWGRYRPAVVIIEDIAEFRNGASRSGTSAIRSFMLDRDYALASQAVFSSFYVDLLAFDRRDRDEGFQLNRSQMRSLLAPQ